MYGEVDIHASGQVKEATVVFHLESGEHHEYYRVSALRLAGGFPCIDEVKPIIAPAWTTYNHTRWERTILKDEVICVIYSRSLKTLACTWIFDGKNIRISRSSWDTQPEIKKVQRLKPVEPPAL